jgi:glycosyltransferase involved in cell wall biosynthesis
MERRARGEASMAIGLVGPFPPPFGGMAVYFDTLARELEREGIASSRIVVPAGSLGARLRGFFGASWRVVRGSFDVVHCVTGSQPNLLANAMPLGAARVARKRSVLSIVGGEFHGAVVRGTVVRRLVLRIVLSLPHQVIACNDQIGEALQGLGVPAERITLLSNALPLQARCPASADEADGGFADFAATHGPLIASVSGWYEHYGSLDLVQAFAALRTRHPDIGLTLIFKDGGDAAFAQSLRAAIGEASLADHVLLLTNVPSVTAIMAASDVFVRTPHLEGDSVSVREALAVGVPVVASDAGFRPPDVLLYRPADAADLERALEQVLAGPPPERGGDQEAEGQENVERLLGLYRALAGAS